MATDKNESNKADDAPAGEPKAAKAGKGAKGAKGGQGKGASKGKGGKGSAAGGPPPVYKREKAPRLREVYERDVVPKLRAEFGYKSAMQVPRVVKISVNMGLGKAVSEPKMLESAVEEMRLITGQGPVITRARSDIANFKLRVGHKIGCMVTLRRHRMWEFLDRLVSIALPRVRDFKGVSDRAFDGRGNYSLGVREQIIFPEIDYDSIDSVKGLNVTIVTTARTDEEALALLRHLGMPFRRRTATQENEAAPAA